MFKLSLCLFILSAVCGVSASVDNPTDSYQEVTYEDLLREINGQKRKISKSTIASPLDEVKIHMGIGMTSAITHFNINSTSYERFQNGMTLALGIDLFSDSWFSECLFKNYGLNTRGNEEVVLRELDLLLGYKQDFNANLGYFIKSGLSNRYLKFSELSTNTHHDENSPHFYFATGLNVQMNQHLGVAFEINGQSAVAQSTSLKNAVEFGLRINTSL